MGERVGHEALAVAALRRLGREPAADPLTVRLPAGGRSGSAVYRLDLAGVDVVLKVTLPSVDRRVMLRARREALFYRDLAARVPVSTPPVLGLAPDQAEGVVLLLAAYAPAPPPDRWTEEAYAEVARQLGRLHAAFCDKTAASALPGWLPATPRVTLARCRAAARQWRALGKRDECRDALGPRRRRLERLLLSIPALEPRMPSAPATLCHGDCHADNLLQGSAGEWVWADWQDVRLGPGVDDPAFFWQRAFAAADTAPPYDAIVRAYAAGLETGGGAPMSRERLDQALAWAELRSWLVDWPGYLGALSAARLERVLGRIETLIDRLAGLIAGPRPAGRRSAGRR